MPRVLRAFIWVAALAMSVASHGTAQPEDPRERAASILAEAQGTLIADPEEGLSLARDAELLSRRTAPDPEILQKAAWLQAEALFRLNRLPEAASILQETLDTYPPTTSPISGKLLIAQGRVARANGQVGLALSSFQESFRIFNELDVPRYKAISLQSMGILYSQARQFERAIDYDKRAVAAYPDDAVIRVASLNLRGNAYKAMGAYADARRHFEAALELEAVRNSPPMALRLLSNIAALEYAAGNPEAASRVTDQAAELAAGLPDGGVAVPRLLTMIRAMTLNADGNQEAAVGLVDRAYRGVDLTATTQDDREAHHYARIIYAGAGRYEDAFAHLTAEKRLEDAERELAASANLAILNAEFELSNKELEIANLKADRLAGDIDLVRARRNQERLLAGAASIIGLGLIAFLVWQTVQSTRTRRQSEVLTRRLENLNAKLKRSNADLEKANSAKTEFLATTSHEIRTPLNAVINLTESVLQDLPDGGKNRNRLKTALRSAEHLHAIVTDVLDVARFEGKRVQVHLSTVDLAAVITDVIDLWKPKAAEKSISLNLTFDLDAKFFRTDERLLRQVLSNLISNAIKFTQEGSIDVTITGGDERNPLTIRVADTGIGIGEEDQQIIFESFRQADRSSTRNFGGTGLGLAICQQIAQLLGGDIRVESALGAGSTFTVALPFRERAMSEDIPTPAVSLNRTQVEETLGNLRILAAEDNQVNALVIQTILSSCVASLDIVGNGAEAVTAMEEGNYDVVLMDKQMPVMDGVEATRRIRSLPGERGSVPIIAVTADAFVAARDEILAAGADEYLSKPIRPDDLKQLIATTWTTSRARQRLRRRL